MCLIPPLCSQYEAIGPTSRFCQYETKVPTSGFCKYETKVLASRFSQYETKVPASGFCQFEVIVPASGFCYKYVASVNTQVWVLICMWPTSSLSQSEAIADIRIFFDITIWDKSAGIQIFSIWYKSVGMRIFSTWNTNFLKTSCKNCANLATPPLQGYFARGILTFPGYGITPGEIDT